jgi:hypothetical protein
MEMVAMCEEGVVLVVLAIPQLCPTTKDQVGT